ncbi:MAG TPA: glutamate mutase L, partial [Ktedonobacteraceae bacterium]|nr:glutamate mutase L [Ktedonobacteraceae bacterium]
SSQNPASASSIMVADCGATFTKVSLLGLVEGQYRLIARGVSPTTSAGPNENVTRGVIQAINEIEYITGRRFVTDGKIVTPEEPSGDGVDLLVSTMSVGGPMRLVVLGGVTRELETLAAQSVSGLHAETYAIPAPAYRATMAPEALAVGTAGRPASSPAHPTSWTPEQLSAEWERQIARMRELQPHAALIVGSADNPVGAAALQEACQLVIQTVKALSQQAEGGTYQLPVIYAGAPQFVEAVRRMLNGHAEVTRVETLLSQAQLGPVSMAASALFERDVLRRVPGYETLRSWSNAVPVGTASSLSSLVRFLAQHYAMNVTAVDVGSNTTTLMMAGERGEFIPLVNTGLGVGTGLGAILQRVGVQRIARWLPFTASEDELRQFAMNHMLHPQSLPTSQRELHLFQAFAREAIILTRDAARGENFGQFEADLILATGGVLAHAPKFGQAALMLLDALQPRGVTSLVLDRTMLISQLGAVATVAPVAAVQVNENDAVMHRLGTCVVPFGDLPQGQTAIRVGVEYSNGRQVTAEVMSGSIEIIPLKLNDQALLTLYPAPSVDVGLGPGERARAAEEIDGGLVGLIIDARGRPLAFPANETERQARLLQWMQIIGA